MELEINRNAYPTIPENTLSSLERYINQKLAPGGFVGAVLRNNLTEAVNRADENNVKALLEIVRLVYWEIPGDSWGSPEKVQAWLDSK